MPETTGPKQGQGGTSGKFPKGKSGNPAGRPKGARNRATVAAESLLDGEAKQIARKCIDLALAGDSVALRLCMERLVPPRKGRPLAFPLPGIRASGDVLAAVNAVLEAVSSGQITVDEADGVLRAVDAARRAIETEDLYREICVLREVVAALDG